MSGKSPAAKAIHHALSHSAELTRKNALFAGGDDGARHSACLASLIETANLNALDPLAYLIVALEALAGGHPINCASTLLPWRWAAKPSTV